MKNAILFFYMGSTNCIPLIEAVSKSGFVPIANDPSLLELAKTKNLAVVNFVRFAPDGNLKHAQQNVSERIKRIAEEMENTPPQQTFMSSLGDFRPNTKDKFLKDLFGFLINEIMVIETLEALIRNHHLKLIVLGCDNSHIQRAVVKYASLKNIPTLQIAHGLFTKPIVQFAGNIPPLYSDYVAVHGMSSREIFLEDGTKPDCTFTTGSLSWDYLYKSNTRIPVNDARRKLGLDPKLPVVLYCSSYADGASLFYIPISKKLSDIHKAVIHSVKSLKQEVQLVIRPHPNELKRAGISNDQAIQIYQTYKEWLEDEGVSNVHIITENKVASIRAADVVVAINNSSMIPEAMILEKPIIKMSFNEWDAQTCSKEDGIEVIEDYSKLPGLMEGLLSNPGKRETMVKRQNVALPMLNHKNDGKATERISELIIDLANQEKGRRKNCEVKAIRNSNLKILEVVHNFPPYQIGGTELYTLNLAKEMQSLGQDVTVLHPIFDCNKEEFSFELSSFEGLKVVRFNQFSKTKTSYSEFLNPEFDLPFGEFLKNNHFDVIHFQHIYGLSANWISIAKASGAKVVLKIDDFYFYCKQIHLYPSDGSYCSGPESLEKCLHCCYPALNGKKSESLFRELEYRNKILQSIFSTPDLVHTPSCFAKESHQKNGFVNSNFKVISTGILPFKVLPKVKSDKDEIRVAFVGAIDRRKGILDFIRAIEHFVHSDNNNPNKAKIKFEIYGNHANDDLAEFVFAKVAELNCLHYRGKFTQEDRSQIFAQIDVIVIPSIGENYPFVIREALYANIPVISTNISGVPEIIEHGVNGFLFPPDDFKSLAEIFEKIQKETDLHEKFNFSVFAKKTVSEEATELIEEFNKIPESKVEQPLVSIVIVTFNSASTIRTCLNSALGHNQVQSEIIVVDNNSSDKTVSILNEFKGRIRTISNKKNYGFSFACNLGISNSSGEYVVLLNPDCVVTNGWLDNLIYHFTEDVGAVGPISNYAAGIQNMYLHIEKSLEGNIPVQNLSLRIFNCNRGKSIETKLLIGFCLMISKKAVEKVGLLDENLFLGNDDLDYSLRLREAGFKLLVAADTLIYHKGHISFDTLSSNEKQQMEQLSLDRFYDKLENKYGSGKVPSPTLLWGIDILGVPSKFTQNLDPLLKAANVKINKKRVAIIYDNIVHPDTTGEYCKKALSLFCHVDHYLPTQISKLVPGSYDLFLFIDDDLDYPIPYHLRPNAWWVIDTHLKYDKDLKRARYFDFTFAAQQDGAAKLKRDGVNNVKWLPLAADPEIHKKHDITKKYDISFVGRYSPGVRNNLLETIKSNFDNVYIGQKFFDEMAKTFSASRIIFNRSIKNDINMRVFEAMSTGSLLVTNDLSDNGMSDLFKDGEELVQYSSEADLLNKLKFYLKDKDKREKIAKNGRKCIIESHTYSDRMKVLLNEVFENVDNLMGHSQNEMVSIILVTYNGLEVTKNCVESIRKFTNVPYELIIVDNGSTDGTLDYLESQSNINLIRNSENLGFSAGNNIGIKNSKGDYILLLNNDTIVTENWLKGLLRAINLAPEVGLAGPKTNWIFSNTQIVKDANYKTEEELQTFAKDFTDKNRNQYELTNEKLVGFCLLIKKEVIDKVGYLDEDFGTGNFEDDDYCLRSRLAGYEKIVAGDVFIHHEGNFSFKTNNINYQDQMDRNLSIFKEKWKDEIEFRGREYFLKRDLAELARVENDHGEKAFEKNELSNAKNHFEKALELNPEFLVARNNLGVVNWQVGENADAMDCFLSVLEKDSKNLDAIENLMQIVPSSEFDNKTKDRFREICKENGLVDELT